MSEETAKELIEALNNHTEALNMIGRPLTKKEVQKVYGLGRGTVKEMFENPNFKTQKKGNKRFATREEVNCYLQETQNKK